MPFQFQPLESRHFEGLFDLSDEELRAKGARRVIADAHPGFPCRISLCDAAPGDEVILANHKHLDIASPYAASHAVYVRKGAEAAAPAVGEVPAIMEGRVLSVRAFDQEGLMQVGELAEAPDLAPMLEAIFDDAAISFADIHFAKRGCFAARATRA